MLFYDNNEKKEVDVTLQCLKQALILLTSLNLIVVQMMKFKLGLEMKILYNLLLDWVELLLLFKYVYNNDLLPRVFYLFSMIDVEGIFNKFLNC